MYFLKSCFLASILLLTGSVDAAIGKQMRRNLDESDSHDHDDDEDRIPGTEECGKCKHGCADNDQDVIDSIFGVGATFDDSGECKGACSDLYGSHFCMCGGDLCSKYDDDRIPGTHECGACKTACSKDDTDRLEYIFNAPTNFADSGECKGACSDKFGSHYCMCSDSLCSAYDEDRIEGTHECGACKSACSRSDQERIDYIFGEPSTFESSGPCKGACMDKFGDDHCMCGDSLCTEYDSGEPHSHDHDDEEERIPGTEECGVCKHACADNETDVLMNLFDTATPTGGESGTCKGACQDKYGSHYCMCNDELCSKYEEDRIAGTHECGACKTACSKMDTDRLDYIFGVPTNFEDSGSCKGSCGDKFGNHNCMCGNNLCSKYEEDRIPGTHECGACKTACANSDTERLEYIFGVPLDMESFPSGDCKGACSDLYGSHYCMCSDDLCSKYDDDRIEGTHECGACKTACSRDDQERLDYIFGEGFDLSGGCKSACQDKFGDDHCMCGDNLCTDFEAGESHDHPSSEDERIPGTEECGMCKHACADNDTDTLMILFDTATPTGGESDSCKGACQDKYGSHYCMCSDELCSKYEEDRIPGTHECGACKTACSKDDAERLDYIFGVPTKFEDSGQCKNACQDNFGSHFCMCSDDLCSKYDADRIEGTHECGACKTACSRGDQERIDYIFGEPSTFESSGPCKGACSDKFGDENCMCGNSLCSEFVDGESHSHDDSKSVDSHDHDGNSISDLACGNEDFSVLCSLIEACPMDGLKAPMTVFAPTDAAFADLDAAVNGLANVDIDILCGILEFHIVAGSTELYASDLSAYCTAGDASLLEMANGVASRVKCTKDTPYGIKGGGNDSPANFIDVDIVATDGVIHTIDNVLFYPRVLDNNMGGSGVAPSFRGALP